LAQGVEEQCEPREQRRGADQTSGLTETRSLATPLCPTPADDSDRDRCHRAKNAHDAKRCAEVGANHLHLRESDRADTGDGSHQRNHEPNGAHEKHEDSHDARLRVNPDNQDDDLPDHDLSVSAQSADAKSSLGQGTGRNARATRRAAADPARSA